MIQTARKARVKDRLEAKARQRKIQQQKVQNLGKGKRIVKNYHIAMKLILLMLIHLKSQSQVLQYHQHLHQLYRLHLNLRHLNLRHINLRHLNLNPNVYLLNLLKSAEVHAQQYQTLQLSREIYIAMIQEIVLMKVLKVYRVLREIFEKFVIDTMKSWVLSGNVGSYVNQHFAVFMTLIQTQILLHRVALVMKIVHNMPIVILCGSNFTILLALRNISI
mmetsp:Transcript_27338/g.33803  ORF Transcript_27338/g.33803 Transcript_27338/m.33803 type:complete len:219 (-) Transcript_27338:382-1038(-)